MCLSTIEWKSDPLYHHKNGAPLYDDYPLRIWRGWKIFTYPYPSYGYMGSWYGGPYQPNTWYLATKYRDYTIPREGVYPLGFHAYINKADARQTIGPPAEAVKHFHILPVQLMGVKVRGEDYKGPCLVADWMLIEEGARTCA